MMTGKWLCLQNALGYSTHYFSPADYVPLAKLLFFALILNFKAIPHGVLPSSLTARLHRAVWNLETRVKIAAKLQSKWKWLR